MLEDIALSISTLLFLMCSLFLNSVSPSVPADTNAPTETAEQEVVCFAGEPDETDSEIPMIADLSSASIVGKWECLGSRYEFTDSGKLIFNGEVLRYSLESGAVVVNTGERVYALPLERINARSIKLGGVTFYRVN